MQKIKCSKCGYLNDPEELMCGMCGEIFKREKVMLGGRKIESVADTASAKWLHRRAVGVFWPGPARADIEVLRRRSCSLRQTREIEDPPRDNAPDSRTHRAQRSDNGQGKQGKDTLVRQQDRLAT